MHTILSRVRLNKKQIISMFVFMLLASVAEMMLPTMLAGMIDKINKLFLETLEGVSIKMY